MSIQHRLLSRRGLRMLSFSTILLTVYCVIRYTQTDGPRPSFAYVFYATQDTYACSALINVFALRYTFNTRHRIIILVSHDVSSVYREAFANLGATVLTRAPPPLHPDSIGYYQGCLLKLVAFQLFDLEPPLERVVVMDSDQLILKDLDPAFDFPQGGVLAPKAYWIDNRTYSSTLMEFQPSLTLWNDVNEAIRQVPADTYDMDITNQIFRESFRELPPTYGTLNSHWEDSSTPSWFLPEGGQTETPNQDENMRELFSKVHVLHFTAVGKPWMYDVARLLAMRPKAHPILVEQWAFWRTQALQLCPSGIIDHVYQLTLHVHVITLGSIYERTPLNFLSGKLPSFIIDLSAGPPISSEQPASISKMNAACMTINQFYTIAVAERASGLTEICFAVTEDQFGVLGASHPTRWVRFSPILGLDSEAAHIAVQLKNGHEPTGKAITCFAAGATMPTPCQTCAESGYPCITLRNCFQNACATCLLKDTASSCEWGRRDDYDADEDYDFVPPKSGGVTNTPRNGSRPETRAKRAAEGRQRGPLRKKRYTSAGHRSEVRAQMSRVVVDLTSDGEETI